MLETPACSASQGGIQDWEEVGTFEKALLEHGFVEEAEAPYIPGQAVKNANYCPQFSSVFGVHAGCDIQDMSLEMREVIASVGLSFETEQQCCAWIKRAQAEQILRRDAKGFKPDWGGR